MPIRGDDSLRNSVEELRRSFGILSNQPSLIGGLLVVQSASLLGFAWRFRFAVPVRKKRENQKRERGYQGTFLLRFNRGDGFAWILLRMPISGERSLSCRMV